MSPDPMPPLLHDETAGCECTATSCVGEDCAASACRREELGLACPNGALAQSLLDPHRTSGPPRLRLAEALGIAPVGTDEELVSGASFVREAADGFAARLTVAERERDEARAEVERLRGDVREYRRQLGALGGAAGRGEQLDAPARLRAAAQAADDHELPGVAYDLRDIASQLDTEPDGDAIAPAALSAIARALGVLAAAPSPVREPAPAEEPCTCDHARSLHRDEVQECSVTDCACDEWWSK